jgi:hypothetical protein
MNNEFDNYLILGLWGFIILSMLRFFFSSQDKIFLRLINTFSIFNKGGEEKIIRYQYWALVMCLSGLFHKLLIKLNINENILDIIEMGIFLFWLSSFVWFVPVLRNIRMLIRKHYN